jgi:hypothetical protein
MQPGMIQMPMQGNMPQNMPQNMGVPQGHPGMVAGQNINPNFLGNMDQIRVQQQDGLRSQEAGQLVVPASNVSQRVNPQQFPNMLQQQGANRGPVMNPGLAAQQQQQQWNAQQNQQEKLQTAHNLAQAQQAQHAQAQAQAHVQAQARLNAQAKAAQQISMTGGGFNPQQIPMSQSPAMPTMPMLNRSMNQVPQPQGTPQPRPPSRMPQVTQDSMQQPSLPLAAQHMVQNPNGMQQRPPIPDFVPPNLRQQLASMSEENYKLALQKIMQTRRSQILAQQQRQALAQQQQGGMPQQQPMMRAANMQNPAPSFNPQLQHQMQPTPIPTSQPNQPQQQQPGMNMTPSQRPQDNALTDEENMQVNQMASEMAKTTPKAEMDKIRANLQNMSPEHKESLAKRGLEPLAFFFRSQAVGRFKKNKAEMLRRQAMAQNGGVDPMNNQMMPQQQRPMPPQTQHMQMQGSQGQPQPTSQAPQMAGIQPGQMMPAQLPARGPNGQQQTPQIPQNRLAQQSVQQPQQPQQQPQQQRPQGLLKVPNDLARGQSMNGPAMTNEQITSMDKIAFPNGIINSQNNAVPQLPKNVKTWGQLKQWATSQKQDQDGVTLQKLLTLQRLHFMQNMAQNRSAMPANAAQQSAAGNTSANDQANVQMTAQAARVGQGVPPVSNSGPAPPIQQQKSQQGNQPTRPPHVQTGLLDGWQPSLQEIQRARISLPQHAQAWTDEMVRQFLVRAREHKMKEFQQRNQHNVAQHIQQPQPQPAALSQPQVPQTVPAPTGQQSRPQSQPGPRQPLGPPNNVTGQAPNRAGRGTPLQQQQPQPPPARAPLKRSNSDEVMEIPNPNPQPPRQPPAPGQPGQAAQAPGQPMNIAGSGPRPITKEQFEAMSPEQKARYQDFVRRQNAARGMLLPGMAPNDPDMRRINETLRRLLGEETQKMSATPRPPVNMPPEHRATLIQKLPRARDLLTRIDGALRAWFKISGDENRARQIVQQRILLSNQFKKVDTGTPADHFTVSLEEFDKTLSSLTQYFQIVMQQFGRHPASAQQQAAAQTGQAAQMALNAQNLQQHEQQQAAMHNARQAEQQQQKQTNKDSRAPPAPTSTAPPFALGPHSPQGIPRAYGPNEVTRDKLKLPPRKKQKGNNQASAGSTPVQVQGTPAATSPQVSKPSPEIKKQPENAFRCTVPGCEFGKKGFATQPELVKHVEDTHRPKEKPIEKPVEFALDKIRKGLGLDENGKMKAPKAAQKPAPQPMKREESKQSATTKVKDEKPSNAGTPMNRPVSQLGKAASPASATLKTPQMSNVKSTAATENKDDHAQSLARDSELRMAKLWEDSNVTPGDLDEAFVFINPPNYCSFTSDLGLESWHEVKYSSVLDTSSSSEEERSPPKAGSDSPEQPGSDVTKVVNVENLDLSVTPDIAADKMEVDATKKSVLFNSWDKWSTGSYDPLDDTWFKDLCAQDPEYAKERHDEGGEVAPEDMYLMDWENVGRDENDGLLESEAWKEWFHNK